MPSGISCIDASARLNVGLRAAGLYCGGLIRRSMQRYLGCGALDGPTRSGMACQGLDGKASNCQRDALAQEAVVLPDFKRQQGGVKHLDAGLGNLDPGPSTLRDGRGTGQYRLTQPCLTPFQARDFGSNFGKVISKAQTVHQLLPFMLCSVRMSNRLVNDRYLFWSFP